MWDQFLATDNTTLRFELSQKYIFTDIAQA